RLERDARIKVDVRVELLLDEVIVRQRDALELERDLEDRVVAVTDSVQHLMTCLLHDLRPRIIVLIDAVTEAHEPERITLVLCPLDIFRNAIDRADLLQHLKRSLVGAPVSGAPQARDTRRDTGKGICT